ncbi:MAG: GNAT family N-acetyltransferase [Candidatus Bathyarchaeota archaeon]|nr:GNAT family N-acetyltransferase [Candidatus Bathyarchaeota archaeon]MDH5495271.1 GNAT family N-acetyltransferase [Candidatus Bathyarchaeota archaeon]
MLKVYSHNDADAKSLLPEVSKYTEMAKLMKLPFWILVEDSNPIGLVTTGKEPLQLLAPIGTPVAMIDLIQKNQPRSILTDFASQSLKLAIEKEAEYATVELTSEEGDAIDSFLEVKFKVLADTFRMNLQLDRDFDSPQGLQFEQTRKEEMLRWIQLASRFLSGSADVVMERILRYLGDLPENLMEMYYSLEKFYFASLNKREIGILNFSSKAGRISNVGIDPARRGQGYGRQIMLFALKQLQAGDCKQARLRVHIKNKPAINLYKSLGFEVSERRKLLIYENKEA